MLNKIMTLEGGLEISKPLSKGSISKPISSVVRIKKMFDEKN